MPKPDQEPTSTLQQDQPTERQLGRPLSDAQSPPQTEPSDQAEDGDPRWIGNFKILRVLGQGGMGRVYVAEQSAPLARRVALKVMRAGLADDVSRRRFELERHALARLSHRNIARAFEAGSTADGSPWVAMELVEGEHIDLWCDRRRLSIRDRLALFAEVCDGVQHAHERGLLHRDLKPANVLVALEGERPTPKIIDFGIARRLDDEAGLLTEGQYIGTPYYLSPEILRLGSREADTRSDVYGLGLILYQLVVGALPFATAGRPLPVVLKAICEDQKAPRARFAEILLEHRSTTAENRKTTSTKLSRELEGELGWILQKAVHSDRELRYRSAAALAEDLRLLLEGRPVSAVPPSAWYQLRSMLRRHRAPATVGAVALVLLLTALVSRTIEARRATREARVAEAVTSFLIKLFEVADPGQAQGQDLTARQIVDRGVEKIHQDLMDQPAIRARLLGTLGAVSNNLGHPERAATLFEEAVKVESDPARLVTLRLDVAKARFQLGEIALARRQTKELLASLREQRARKEEIGRAQAFLGEVLREAGEREAAERELKQGLALLEATVGPDDREAVAARNGLAVIAAAIGESDRAEALFARNAEISERLYGPKSADLAVDLDNLAGVYVDRGELARAATVRRRAAEIFAEVLGEQHSSVAISFNNLGQLYRTQGELAAAEAAYRKAVTLYEKTLGPDHQYTGIALDSLGGLLLARGETADALALAQRAVKIQESGLGDAHLFTAYARAGLSEVLESRGDFAEALAVRRRSVEILERELPETNSRRAAGSLALARLELALGQPQRAAERLAVQLAKPEPTAENEVADFARVELLAGEVAAALGDTARAAALYQRARARLQPVVERSERFGPVPALARTLLLVGDVEGGKKQIERMRLKGFEVKDLERLMNLPPRSGQGIEGRVSNFR